MIRKAVVLAAGRGTRMGDLTDELPKPMLPLGGRPMLAHVTERLRAAGVAEILVVVGYRGELIERYFGDFAGVSFATQTVVDGTASAVRLARKFVDRDTFLLTFGDILTPPESYSGIATDLETTGASAVLGVRFEHDPCRGAAVYADATGRVTRIIEKPPAGSSTTNWNSAGLYALTPGVFRELDTIPRSARGEYEITSAIEQLVQRGQLVRFFEMPGEWRDVGRPEDLAGARREVEGRGIGASAERHKIT